MPIFTSAVVTPTQGSLETAITAYADANSAANTVAVYANSNVILNSANLNFNNTDSISVSVTPNTVNQANIAFSVRNRLGIGTNNPSANLHVIGNTLITTDLTVAGNLFVEGNTTTLNVQTLEIEDNDIVLNANTTGSPTLNATITIDRGTSTNTFLRWNEVTDRWGWSDNGTTFEAFEDLVKVSGDTMTGSLNVTAGGVNISSGGLAVTGGANVVSGGLAITGGANVISGGLAVTGGANIAGGSNITNGIVVTGGATISGNTNFDSGTLFVDSVNDRVGVGITNPTSSLHVVGSGSLDSGSILLGASSVFGKLWLANTSLGTNIDNTRDLLRLHTTTGNADSLDFFKLRDGAGSSWDSAGWRIQEKVDATWMGWMQFNGNGLTGGISFGTGTNTTSPRSVAERMRINNDGNVGIGTTSVDAKLRVDGDVKFVTKSGSFSWDNGLMLYDAAATNRWQILHDGSNGNILRIAYNSTEYVRIDTGGRVDLFQGNIYAKSFIDADDYSYYVNPGATASPSALFAGNVGIGLTSPGVKLDVSGTVRASSQLISTVATGTAPLAVSSTTVVTNLNADTIDGYDSSTLVQTSNNSSQTTLWNPYGQYYTSVWGVGNDFNNFVNSGSYHVDNAASNHASAGSYGYLRIWRHIGSNYLLQEFTPSGSAVSTWRRLGQDNGSGSRIWTSWSKYWSDGNDGAGSGLDADLLDGAQGSSYLRSDQSATNSVDLRSPNFYISADTNNRFGQGLLILRNSSPTVYFQDTDHNSAMLHNNSNLLYVLRGGNDTTSWSQVSGQWPFIFNLSNNDATCGGSFAAIGNVTAYSSDRRLKTNIQNIPNALDKVLSLNGVTFDWIDKVKEFGFTPDTMTNDAGVIAQEVQKVLPQAVKPAPFDHQWNNDNNSYVSKSGEEFVTVQYEKLVPLLIEAIKELKKEIEDLKSNRNV